MLPRSLITENRRDLLHPETCDGCSFCTRLQSGTDWRQQMQHVPHDTRNMSDGQKNKNKKSFSRAVQTPANMQVCSHTFSTFFTCGLQTEGGKSEALRTDSLTIQLLASSQFDLIQHCSLQKRLGIKNGYNREF